MHPPNEGSGTRPGDFFTAAFDSVASGFVSNDTNVPTEENDETRTGNHSGEPAGGEWPADLRPPRPRYQVLWADTQL